MALPKKPRDGNEFAKLVVAMATGRRETARKAAAALGAK